MLPGLAHVFDTLRLSAAVWDPLQWHAIHVPDEHMQTFEIAHGKERERYRYNDRSMAEVRRKGKAVLGHHLGLSDFFVPIHVAGAVHAILVVGPFLTRRATRASLLENWRSLTGRQGHPSDPEFSQYVGATLDALLLEGDQVSRLGRMLGCFARLCATEGDAHAIAAEAASLRTQLEQARSIDRMWEGTRSMVDPRTTEVWRRPVRAFELSYLGLSQPPEHALVGLVSGQSDEPDPIGEVLRRDAFQRACVDIARRKGNVIAGRVADHGVVFLLAGARSPARADATLADLGRHVAALARREFGLALHLGVSAVRPDAPLSVRYEGALEAAEAALSRGAPMLRADPKSKRSIALVRELREQLARAAAESNARNLVTKFDRYLEAVGTYAGYRLERAQGHLEAGFELAAQALVATSALDRRSLADMYEMLDRVATEATSAGELFATYRRAIRDLVDAAERPVPAAHDRSLRRAIAHIDRHFAEKIRMPEVAKIAGFVPAYFSQLFKHREGITFEYFLRKTRIEHAKQLLASTTLRVERVGELSGFPLRSYFQHVFKTLVGQTPGVYRREKR
jgi:AraC-like DNA-binding protein